MFQLLAFPSDLPSHHRLVAKVWSVSLRCATLKMRIDSAARSLAYSPSGNHLVVGLGGDRDAMVKEGTVVVLSASTLEILEEVRVEDFLLRRISLVVMR